MEGVINWFQDGWIVLVAIIGGVTLVWNFLSKTLKEIKNELFKPITNISEKVDGISEQLDSMRKDDKLIKNAILNLQRRSLLDSCERYIKRGYATLDEKETVHKQFVSYEELGGNSFVKDLVDNVNKLPLEKVEKNKKEVKE